MDDRRISDLLNSPDDLQGYWDLADDEWVEWHIYYDDDQAEPYVGYISATLTGATVWHDYYGATGTVDFVTGSPTENYLAALQYANKRWPGAWAHLYSEVFGGDE